MHNRASILSIPPPITSPWVHKRFGHGNCSETIPTAVVASISSQNGPTTTEVRSLAAYTDSLCRVKSIAEDGKINVSIKLLGPCLDCKDLMSEIPGSTWMWTGSGRSEDVRWTVVKKGGLCSEPFQRVPSGYSKFSYTEAYTANKDMIYEILKVWTIGSVGVHVKADVREKLGIMWDEFIDPYR